MDLGSGVGAFDGYGYWRCGTPIGASANVVGISVAAKNGHFTGWGNIAVCSSGDGAAGNPDFHGLYMADTLRGFIWRRGK